MEKIRLDKNKRIYDVEITLLSSRIQLIFSDDIHSIEALSEGFFILNEHSGFLFLREVKCLCEDDCEDDYLKS